MMWALDTDGNLWSWGNKLARHSYYENDTNIEKDPFAEGFKDRKIPNKIVWFEKNGLKIIDFVSG